jgi:hypothetical protein
VHVWGNAVAAKGVLGDLNSLVDSPCRSLADSGARVPKIYKGPRERERRLLLRSWAKAEKDSGKSRKATGSEGDDLEEESATRALMRHGGRGRGGRSEGRREQSKGRGRAHKGYNIWSVP